VEATAAALARGDVAAVVAGLTEFDELLLGQICNAMIGDLLQRLQAHLKRLGPAGTDPERLRSAINEHREILGAILTGDGQAAQDLHRLHLRRVLDGRLRASALSHSRAHS
jgi:DNA-binding GntR family transcriptional regulator